MCPDCEITHPAEDCGRYRIVHIASALDKLIASALDKLPGRSLYYDGFLAVWDDKQKQYCAPMVVGGIETVLENIVNGSTHWEWINPRGRVTAIDAYTHEQIYPKKGQKN